MIEDPPPPPPGDTEDLETVVIKVSRFTFNEAKIDGMHVFSHPDTREPIFGRVYQTEIVQNMFNPPDEYILYIEYER